MVATLEFIWGAVNEAFTEHSGSSLCKYKGYRTAECSLGLVFGALAAALLILAEVAGTVCGLRFFRHPMEEESSARALPPVDVEADGEEKGVFVVSVALGWTEVLSQNSRKRGVIGLLLFGGCHEVSPAFRRSCAVHIRPTVAGGSRHLQCFASVVRRLHIFADLLFLGEVCHT